MEADWWRSAFIFSWTNSVTEVRSSMPIFVVNMRRLEEGKK